MAKGYVSFGAFRGGTSKNLTDARLDTMSVVSATGFGQGIKFLKNSLTGNQANRNLLPRN